MKKKDSVSNKKRASGLQEKPVRLRDLAQHLGLSATTVSLVLNDSPVARTLSEETRKRVLKAATDLHYKANYFARALNQKRNYLIGILVPDFGEGYNASFITAIESELIARNYHYFVSSHHWNDALIAKRISDFIERGVEGMVLINTPVSVLPNLPAVIIGSQELKSACTRISLDNESGIDQAARHLYGLGHRDFAFIKGHEGSVDAEPRWRGMIAACKSLKLHIDPQAVVQLERIHDGLDPIAEGRKAVSKLLRCGVRFSALIAFNDMSAVGAIRELKESGLRIPEDVSVVGFDNVQASQIVEPPLTTIAQPIDNMAKLAVNDLLGNVEAGTRSSKRMVIAPKLVVRRSTAEPLARSYHTA